MRRRLAILFLSATVVSDLGASSPSRSVQSATEASTTLRVPGTIDKYDASNRMLFLSTTNGRVQFPVPPAARIRRGGQTIDASQLATLSGYRAAVRYSESRGNKTVQSVHVFGKE
jgi:hypothetical protein